MTIDATWQLSCFLGFDVTEPATIVLQVAPADGAGERVEENLVITLDGERLAPRRIGADHGGVVHVIESGVGQLEIAQEAVIRSSAGPEPEVTAELDAEQFTYLRQSRYCPSDRMTGLAAYEFEKAGTGLGLLTAVDQWVGDRLSYEEGSSGPTDSAVDTLLAGQGVCRDFAHLAITVFRSLAVPARLVAVYAPGLSPMEFHAVAEAHIDGRWWVIDPTGLAPRQSLVRVATGRDAADTAFVTVFDGQAALVRNETYAIIEGDLPVDDRSVPFSLA